MPILKPLKPLKNPDRKIVAYDLEWLPSSVSEGTRWNKDELERAAYRASTDPSVRAPKNVRYKGLKLRLIGVKCDRKGYRSYYRAEDFFDHEFTRENSGCWFYAHAGGLADITHLIDLLIARGYHVSMTFSGSSAVRVEVRKGRNLHWTLVDSLFTIPSSLDDIGKKFGMAKGSVRWDAPIGELRDYNEVDCDILLTALNHLQEMIRGLGSELNSTMASTAMRLFRRRFLKYELHTIPALNRRLRLAYSGGRVEVYRHDEHAGYAYDVNSHYPYMMTKPLPGNYIGASRKPKPGALYIADVTVTVPEMKIPPLAYVTDDSLYFPTGTFRTMVCGPEFELAQETGVRIEKLHGVYNFEPFFDIADYAHTLYGMRVNAQKAKDGVSDLMLKLILNALYGKFGESTIKESILINPTQEELQRLYDAHDAAVEAREAFERSSILDVGYRDVVDLYRDGEAEFARTEVELPKPPEEYTKIPREKLSGVVGSVYQLGATRRIRPGVFGVQKETVVAHCHVPIAAYVTSYGREHIYRLMTPDIPGFEPYYVDTDGFKCNSGDLPSSLELGALKKEFHYDRAHFNAPKHYFVKISDVLNEELKVIERGKVITKNKGFRKLCRCGKELPAQPGEFCPICLATKETKTMGIEGYYNLISGRPVTVRRMMRVREMVARGITEPVETESSKRVTAEARPKRKVFSDGRTRAWTVEELDQEWIAGPRRLYLQDGTWEDVRPDHEIVWAEDGTWRQVPSGEVEP